MYKSSFTVSYDDLVRKIYGDRLEKINALLQNDDYQKISGYLGLPLSISKTLVKVKGTNILGQDLADDMNTDRIPFTVTITVRDSSNILVLQNGIVRFLEEGNVYMAEKKEIKIKEVLEELDFIDLQLHMMDSLKKKYNQLSITENEMKTPNSYSSPGNVYQFSYELYKRKQELLRKKSMPATMQVLDDAIVSKPLTIPLLIVVLLGFLSGAILYIIMKYFIIPVFKGKR